MRRTGLIAARRSAGLSQYALAQKLGCTSVVISRWERGVTAPNAANLTRLTEILGISPKQALSGNVATDDETLTPSESVREGQA